MHPSRSEKRSGGRVFLAAGIGALAVGCGSHTDLMPLEVGKTWNYVTRAGFNTFVEPVKVTRELAVAGAQGYELVGPLGASRLAWKGDTLYAFQTANARFIPAVPLLVPGRKEMVWRGRMESNGVIVPATAHVSHSEEKIKIGGREIPTTLSTVIVQIPDKGIELKTWFQSGVGIVQQEQRTNRVLDVQTQFLYE